MNNFFEDILVKLEGEYWTRKISVSDLSQIEEGIEWADICWFEWCDELIVNASRIPAARNKKSFAGCTDTKRLPSTPPMLSGRAWIN